MFHNKKVALDLRTIALGTADVPRGFDLVNETIERDLCERQFMRSARASTGYSPAILARVAIAADDDRAKAGFRMLVASRTSPMWSTTARLDLSWGDESYAHHFKGGPSQGSWAGARFGLVVSSVLTDSLDDKVSETLFALQFSRISIAIHGNGQF